MGRVRAFGVQASGAFVLGLGRTADRALGFGFGLGVVMGDGERGLGFLSKRGAAPEGGQHGMG